MRCIALTVLLALHFGVCAETKPPAPAESAHDDPRPDLSLYFEAIAKGDEKAALGCWLDDLPRDPEKYAQELIVAYVKERIASHFLSEAIMQKLPKVYAEMEAAGDVTPSKKTIAAAQFLVYRRLAIVKWSSNREDGFPMVLDKHGAGPDRWKISMQQWFETNHSSVGDAVLMSGGGPEASRLVARDISLGKLKTMDDIEMKYLEYFEKIADKNVKDREDKEEKGIQNPEKLQQPK